jgi:RimJ/RimL family protein N-acetyltransferase
VQVRRLTPDDVQAYRQVRLRALREEPTAFSSSYDEERDLPDAVIAGRLRVLPDRGTFGAFDEDRLVGIVTLGREDRAKLRHRGMIFGMYVAPEMRGKGVARQLLSEALALARSVPGLLLVSLGVNAENLAAIALYESLGFESWGLDPDAMMVGDRRYDERYMCCRLGRD